MPVNSCINFCLSYKKNLLLFFLFSFFFFKFRATALVVAKVCKIQKVLNFAYFNQKNTYISACKNVQINIDARLLFMCKWFFFILVFLSPPSSCSSPLSSSSLSPFTLTPASTLNVYIEIIKLKKYDHYIWIYHIAIRSLELPFRLPETPFWRSMLEVR